MISTKYICDKCHKEQDTPEQIWVIEVRCQALNYATDWGPIKLQAHWCRECTERAGFVPQRVLKGESLPQLATLEDVIRDIVKQEIQASYVGN